MTLALDAVAALMVLGIGGATLRPALGALRGRATRRELDRYLHRLLDEARTAEWP